ncbi:MAG: hypothetical protein KGI78_04600 [Patescibacteria group bacterium]|nr:hypothetical protein [Patescibacteria group bacterium]MDE1945545.1 hypothetical protein [Patescibacteria group bacterium]MDE2058089.1 hypothetical protein [Patescibacteria group bacterium]
MAQLQDLIPYVVVTGGILIGSMWTLRQFFLFKVFSIFRRAYPQEWASRAGSDTPFSYAFSRRTIWNVQRAWGLSFILSPNAQDYTHPDLLYWKRRHRVASYCLIVVIVAFFLSFFALGIAAEG